MVKGGAGIGRRVHDCDDALYVWSVVVSEPWGYARRDAGAAVRYVLYVSDDEAIAIVILIVVHWPHLYTTEPR